MIACHRFLRSLVDDKRGATIVEFAIILLPMCVMLIGGMGLAYESYVRAVMLGALQDAARKAAVEAPEFDADGDTLEEQVEQTIRDTVGTIAVNAAIDVKQESFFEFSNIGNPEKLMRDIDEDGKFDEDDGDCFEDANFNEEFDTDTGISDRHVANDVAFYTAEIIMPRLFPIDHFLPIEPNMHIVLETAVRNQPFGDQPVPPVICPEEPD